MFCGFSITLYEYFVEAHLCIGCHWCTVCVCVCVFVCVCVCVYVCVFGSFYCVFLGGWCTLKLRHFSSGSVLCEYLKDYLSRYSYIVLPGRNMYSRTLLTRNCLT